MQIFSGSTFWWPLLKASWQASVLIVVVLAAQWFLGGRLTPRWRFRLWLLVVLRLALPWTVPSAVSLFNLLKFPTVSPAMNIITAEPEVPESAVEPLAQPISPESSSKLAAGSAGAAALGFSRP